MPWACRASAGQGPRQGWGARGPRRRPGIRARWGVAAPPVLEQMDSEAAQGARIWHDDTAGRHLSVSKAHRARVAAAHAPGWATTNEGFDHHVGHWWVLRMTQQSYNQFLYKQLWSLAFHRDSWGGRRHDRGPNERPGRHTTAWAGQGGSPPRGGMPPAAARRVNTSRGGWTPARRVWTTRSRCPMPSRATRWPRPRGGFGGTAWRLAGPRA